MPDFTRLTAIGSRHPLIHCISNLVTANDCANLALAIGASPMMAQAPEEMAEITAISDATVLNTGTPSAEKFRACLICGREAQKTGRPVVLDPVGVGASAWRLDQTGALLAAVSPAILRVNLGEARALLRLKGREHGVDSLSDAGEAERRGCAAALARRYGAAVLLSGPEDVVSDGETTLTVAGGSGRMARITGTGCMLSVLCGAFAAVEPSGLVAAVLASVFWKLCSRKAEDQAGRLGTGSFRTALLDAASTMMVSEFSALGAPLILD